MAHITKRGFEKEFKFKASKSGGKGGQHVNKVNTKVTLKWDVVHSGGLSQEQKDHILKKLWHHLTKDGVLFLSSSAGRSQFENKETAISKLDRLLKIAFTPRKIRKTTKPGKAAKRKRLNEKKMRAEKKHWRQKPSRGGI